MKKFLIFIFASFVCADLGATIVADSPEYQSFHFDKNTMISKKINKAKIYIEKGDYIAAQSLLNGVLKLSPSNTHAKSLLDTCKRGVVAQKQKEKEAYEKACIDGSVAALQAFISKYPKSSFVDDVKERIIDYYIWEEARTINTSDSYHSYLQKSHTQIYKKDVEKALLEIEAEKEWKKCKQFCDEESLSKFIEKYPSTKYADEAAYWYNIVVGEKYYDNNRSLALYYLSKANDYQTLTGIPALHIKDLKDEKEIKEILSSNDIQKVEFFFMTLNNDNKYYNQVSNHIANLKAGELNAFSSDYKMQEALSYAKDDETRTIVKKSIRIAKADRVEYTRLRRIAARKAWWKDRINVGWNIMHIDYSNSFWGLGTGAKLRFGRWSDVLNITLGLEYAYHMYYDENDDDYYDDETTPVAHQIDIPLGLRFNLFKISSKYKFYMGCDVTFGYNVSNGSSDFKDLVCKKNLSTSPILGIESDKFDFGIYYRIYSNGKPFMRYVESKYNQRIGAFITWYF